MIGYHYTSKANYKKIKKHGIKKYDIDKNELDYYFPGGIIGIWVWKQELRGKSELGALLHHLATKKTTKLVKLKIHYLEEDKLEWSPTTTVEIRHEGYIGDWHYHTGKDDEKAVILTKNVHPENIVLVKEYDILELVCGDKHGNIPIKCMPQRFLEKD